MDSGTVQARTVIVLAMHRTGTSLIANLLHNACGAKMGARFLGKGPWNHHGVWEDLDFLAMNKRLLRGAGAIKPAWRHPPAQEAISARANVIPVTFAVRSLVYRKSNGSVWGWKDPRTCLTIGLYAPHLTNPVYITTKRKEADIIKSLRKRGGRHPEDFWRKLVHRYEQSRDAFLETTDAPRVEIEFSRLVSKATWGEELGKIGALAGMAPDFEKAERIIEWR